MVVRFFLHWCILNRWMAWSDTHIGMPHCLLCYLVRPLRLHATAAYHLAGRNGTLQRTGSLRRHLTLRLRRFAAAPHCGALTRCCTVQHASPPCYAAPPAPCALLHRRCPLPFRAFQYCPGSYILLPAHNVTYLAAIPSLISAYYHAMAVPLPQCPFLTISALYHAFVIPSIACCRDIHPDYLPLPLYRW